MYVPSLAEAVAENRGFLPVLSLYASARASGQVPGRRTPRARPWLREVDDGTPGWRARHAHRANPRDGVAGTAFARAERPW